MLSAGIEPVCEQVELSPISTTNSSTAVLNAPVQVELLPAKMLPVRPTIQPVILQ